MQAEWRAELIAVREGLELRTAQLEHDFVGACERLETNSPADNEVSALQAECEGMRLELAERQRRCGA